MKANIFDTMKKTGTFENIKESTILEQTGASTERIINGVFEKIGKKEGNKMKRKNTTKRTAIWLAAAAVAVAGICSIPAIAGSMHTKQKPLDGYTEVINFETAKDIKVTSRDENIQVNNVSLGGDETRAIVEITLSKKDGTAFIGENYITGNLMNNTGVCSTQFTSPVSGTYLHSQRSDVVLENDNRTAKITLIGYYEEGLFEKGDKAVVECQNFRAYSVDEVLKSYPKDTDYAGLQEMYAFCDEENDKRVDISQTSAYIIYTGTEYQVVEGKSETVDVPVDIELALDYENDPNEMTISLDKETANQILAGVDTGSITVTPYGIDFKLDTQNVFTEETPENDVEPLKEQYTVLTMKDGKTYYASYPVFPYQIETMKTGLTTTYTQYYSPYEPTDYLGGEFFDTSVYILDPNEIQTISINGNTIYTISD